MKTPLLSIAMFLVASLLGAFGQFLYKTGADTAGGSFSSYLFNPRLLGGVVCYVAVMVLFVTAFRLGGSMTVLYPIYATTFIWAALIARSSEGTPITTLNIGGMIFLICGMFLMGTQS